MSRREVTIPSWSLQLQFLLSVMVGLFSLVLVIGADDKERVIAGVVFLLALGIASVAGLPPQPRVRHH